MTKGDVEKRHHHELGSESTTGNREVNNESRESSLTDDVEKGHIQTVDGDTSDWSSSDHQSN